MSIQGINPMAAGMQMSSASPVVGGRFDGQLQGALGDVGSMLGMTPQQLNASLSSGGTLSTVANTAGVSEQRLVSAIKQGLQDAGSKLTGTRLDNIANRIARHHGMQMRADASTTLMPDAWGATANPSV